MAKKTNKVRWSIEDIPDSDKIYYRMHEDHYKDDPKQILGSGFRPQGKSMSTDWNEYSTPIRSWKRAKEPEKNKIVILNAGKVRKIPLEVVHAPDLKRKNRSHTDVIGLADISRSRRNNIRAKLSTSGSWALLDYKALI